MKTEKRREENKPEKVLSSYDEENSRNEESASRENAGAELDICTGSSEAAWNSTEGWSKYGCNAAIERLSELPFRAKVTSVLSHPPSHWILYSEQSDSELVDHTSSLEISSTALNFVGTVK